MPPHDRVHLQLNLMLRSRDEHDDAVDDGGPEYTDVSCSICGRHNRIAHMVGLTDALRLCSVCVSEVGAVMDGEVGAVGPQIDWSSRWPLKRPDDLSDNG
jgi:hypothetical protein